MNNNYYVRCYLSHPNGELYSPVIFPNDTAMRTVGDMLEQVFERTGVKPVGAVTVRETDPTTYKSVRVGVEKEIDRTRSYSIRLADVPTYVEPKPGPQCRRSRAEETEPDESRPETKLCADESKSPSRRVVFEIGGVGAHEQSWLDSSKYRV